MMIGRILHDCLAGKAAQKLFAYWGSQQRSAVKGARFQLALMPSLIIVLMYSIFVYP